MSTLEEALALGRGIERPFQCFKHDDSTASASVNIAKNVWYCYVCHQGGVVDSNRTPTHDELMAMLEPETAARTFPESWLFVYGIGGYWESRFPRWVCWAMGLGEDPWTGEPTFPVHTPSGKLAGVGRRAAMPGPGPRYRYPYHWSASRSLFGTKGAWRHKTPWDVVVLVEGAADASAVWETGVVGVATYGAGVHHPQVELIAAMRPRLILLGFDTDEAGARATEQSEQKLAHLAEIECVEWSKADPADTPVEDRWRDIYRTVVTTTYGSDEFADSARARVEAMNNAYVEEVEDGG